MQDFFYSNYLSDIGTAPSWRIEKIRKKNEKKM